MKKRIFTALLAMIAALCLCFGLAACAGVGTEGTYYLIENDKYVKETYFTLQGGKWTDDDGVSGEYEINGDAITLYTDLFGTKMEFTSGTVKDGVLTLKGIYGDKVYAQEGAWKVASGSGGGNQNNGSQGSNPKPDEKHLSYSLSDDQSYYIVTGIGGLEGDIEIPDEWDGKPVKEIAPNAFANTNKVTSIKVGANVEMIGEKAFYQCVKLEKVSLGGKTRTISQRAFEECAALEQITIPASVTSIGMNAFEKCTVLNRIDYIGTVSDWASIDFWYSGANWVRITSNPLSTRYVGELDRELYIDDRLVTDAEISDIKEIKPTAFYGYKKLESVTIGKTVEAIGDSAFYYCDNLKTVTLGGAMQLKTIGYGAFWDCAMLESIVLPDTVRSIERSAFQSCDNLQSIDIGDGVAYIGISAFQSCTSLSTLSFGDNLNTIDEHAFAYCEMLTTVTIPDTVCFIGKYAFDYSMLQTAYFEDIEDWKINKGIGIDYYINVEGLDDPITAAKLLTLDPLQNGYVGNDWEKIWERLRFSLNSDGQSYAVEGYGYGNTSYHKRTRVVIPETYNELPVTRIADGAFEYYYLDADSRLTSIKIPASVTSIGASAFSYCENLRTIDIPTGVTEIKAETFKCCRSFTNIEIPFGVTSIGNSAFDGCSNLQSITIPESVTEIGDQAFWGCSSLQSITIPDSVVSIGKQAFVDCSGLKSVTIGNGVTEIVDGAFSGCTSLTYIEIPNSVTSIGYGAFGGCKSLTHVIIGDGVLSIGERAFEDCENLQEVIFGIDSKLTSIHPFAFRYCYVLKNIVFPNNVTSIGYTVFANDFSLENIFYCGTPSEWDQMKRDGQYLFDVSPNIYFYSSCEPSQEEWSQSSYWWHYNDKTGKIAMWKKPE